jgi:hypothetical protein
MPGDHRELLLSQSGVGEKRRALKFRNSFLSEPIKNWALSHLIRWDKNARGMKKAHRGVSFLVGDRN